GNRSGLFCCHCVTPFGSAMRCGKIEPGIAAIARISNRMMAVRIEVSWRHPHLSHPTNPRRGCVIADSSPSTWSAGRSGSEASLFTASLSVETEPSEAGSEWEEDTAHHRPESRHDVGPQPGEHQDPEHDEQDAASDVDDADMTAQEPD